MKNRVWGTVLVGLASFGILIVWLSTMKKPTDENPAPMHIDIKTSETKLPSNLPKRQDILSVRRDPVLKTAPTPPDVSEDAEKNADPVAVSRRDAEEQRTRALRNPDEAASPKDVR